MSLNWVFSTSIARLQFVDVAVTKQMRVADQFLAVEGCQHAMVKRLLVFGKLAEHGTQLEMVLAKVAEFEKFWGHIKFTHLFCSTKSCTPVAIQVVAYITHTALRLFLVFTQDLEKIFILRKVSDLLL